MPISAVTLDLSNIKDLHLISHNVPKERHCIKYRDKEETIDRERKEGRKSEGKKEGGKEVRKEGWYEKKS